MTKILRVIGTIIGALMVALGGVWIAQGLNLLPGSFMTGDIRWAIIGAILAVVGVGLIARLNRRRA